MTFVLKMDDLDDDCLIAIFSRLNIVDKLRIKGVCRRWHLIAEDYNLFHDQTALGTVVSISCFEKSHSVLRKDVVDTLFAKSCRVLYKGTFDLNCKQLDLVLSKCPELKALVLKFCKSINDEVVYKIVSFCPKIEHLDLSISTLSPTNSCMDIVGHELGLQLKHLNLLGCEGVTETNLSELLANCPILETLVIGQNGGRISGRFLASFSSTQMKGISLYGIEKYDNNGVAAINWLSSGKGVQELEELKLKGQLSCELIVKVAETLPLLKSLEVGDFFTDPWIDATHTAIGRAIARIPTLQRLALELPELIQFDGNVMEIMKSCSQLRSFKMAGGPVSDLTIQLLAKWCPFLERLSLVYTSNFPSHRIRPSDEGLSCLSGLKSLAYLTLNGTHITDEGLNAILSSCKALKIVDIRDSPHISDNALNDIFEAALSRPGQVLQVFIDKNRMESNRETAKEEILFMPQNLRLFTSQRSEHQEDEGLEFEGEEFLVDDPRAPGPDPEDRLFANGFNRFQDKISLEDMD